MQVPALLCARWPTAVDEVVSLKFGPDGVYRDHATFGRIYKDDYGERYLKEAPEYGAEVIECARDICTYIHETHGRFPAHVDAIHVPGVWIQVHHPDQRLLRPVFPRRPDRRPPGARRALALRHPLSCRGPTAASRVAEFGETSG